jgi:hypothetical protein
MNDSMVSARDYTHLEFETGTLYYSQVSGCGWLLSMSNGKSLDPQGIPTEFQVEGLHVRVKYYPKRTNLVFA